MIRSIHHRQGVVHPSRSDYDTHRACMIIGGRCKVRGNGYTQAGPYIYVSWLIAHLGVVPDFHRPVHL